VASDPVQAPGLGRAAAAAAGRARREIIGDDPNDLPIDAIGRGIETAVVELLT
jgi:hypothetical protein